jgi:hypothetical protein
MVPTVNGLESRGESVKVRIKAVGVITFDGDSVVSQTTTVSLNGIALSVVPRCALMSIAVSIS